MLTGEFMTVYCWFRWGRSSHFATCQLAAWNWHWKWALAGYWNDELFETSMLGRESRSHVKFSFTRFTTKHKKVFFFHTQVSRIIVPQIHSWAGKVSGRSERGNGNVLVAPTWAWSGIISFLCTNVAIESSLSYDTSEWRLGLLVGTITNELRVVE